MENNRVLVVSNYIHPVQFNDVITESKEGPVYSSVLRKKSRCHHYLHDLATVLESLGSRAMSNQVTFSSMW